jgi:hypothetical protein
MISVYPSLPSTKIAFKPPNLPQNSSKGPLKTPKTPTIDFSSVLKTLSNKPSYSPKNPSSSPFTKQHYTSQASTSTLIQQARAKLELSQLPQDTPLADLLPCKLASGHLQMSNSGIGCNGVLGKWLREVRVERVDGEVYEEVDQVKGWGSKGLVARKVFKKKRGVVKFVLNRKKKDAEEEKSAVDRKLEGRLRVLWERIDKDKGENRIKQANIRQVVGEDEDQNPFEVNNWDEEISEGSITDSERYRQIDLSALMESASSRSRQPSDEDESEAYPQTPETFRKEMPGKIINPSDGSLVMMQESDTFNEMIE